ncbi:MAG TPA: hypothetical protein VN419_10305 [Humidesulfovibrio sp.]|uniref:hypothetical protein n=1 Tax=Humidesulfovibrio sp. TaxID=2910988 RepID=UPI002CBF5F02|nr:hypothetical protein [Humidesulfovibrio sp.]HWR04397.1 hypothetical protein [Humidesulfovibrio sp.]
MSPRLRTFAALATLGFLLLGPAGAAAMGAKPLDTPAKNATDAPVQAEQPLATREEAKQAQGKPGHVKPDDAEALAQYQTLREYFERQAALDDRLPDVFSRRVRQEETMAFLAARETVNRRGQLERFRGAKVDLSGLTFRRVTADPDLARIQVTGSYTISIPPLVETMEEDALFVLLPEMGQWKIFERRAGWR